MDKQNLLTNLKKIQDRKPNIMGEENFHKFAVLLPMVEINNETHILFEVRSQQLRRQPGEICFPGGRMDQEDFHQKETAIRETCEELGLNSLDITVVATLDYIVTAFGTIIYPFVGKIHDISKVIPSEDEVAEVFTVPLSYLIENEPELYYVDVNVNPQKEFPTHLIPGGKNYKWRIRKMEEYFYFYEGRVIWGLTARILKHFTDLLK